MSSLLDHFLAGFREAAAEGAVLELKLRMLAEKTPSLQRFAHAQKLEDIEDELPKHFPNDLTEADKLALGRCRKLRNKVLHSDFFAARGQLRLLGKEPRLNSVLKVQLNGLSPEEMLDKIGRAIALDEDAFMYASSQVPEGASIFGWLLKMNSGNDFRNAVDAFKSAAAIVDRLANSLDWEK